MKISSKGKVGTNNQFIQIKRQKHEGVRSNEQDCINSRQLLQNKTKKQKEIYRSKAIAAILSKTFSGKPTTTSENSQDILLAKKEPVITGVMVTDFSYLEENGYNFLQIKKLLASQGVNIVALVDLML